MSLSQLNQYNVNVYLQGKQTTIDTFSSKNARKQEPRRPQGNCFFEGFALK